MAIQSQIERKIHEKIRCDKNLDFAKNATPDYVRPWG